MKLRPYSEYKDSGIEWLGQIPIEWKPTRLKHVASIVMGQSPSSDDCNQEGVGIPFLQGCAEFGETHPTPKQYCEVASKVSNAGDLLFSVRAPVGSVNEADQQYGIGRGLCAIRGRTVSHRFLTWSLEYNKTQLNAMATGSTYEAVTINEVCNIGIAEPSQEEQQLILKYLDRETSKLDTLIAKQENLIELLQEKRQAIISHAVTKGLNPDVKMKDSGIEWLGMVPEGWVSLPIKLVITTRKGVAFKAEDFREEGVMVAKASDIKNLTIQNSNVFLPNNFVSLFPKAVLKTGDIILSTVGSTPNVINSAVGQIARLPAHLNGCMLNQNTVVFTPDSTQLTNDYLFYIVRTRRYREHLNINAHGTANQASLNIQDMLNVYFSIPSIEEQKKITDYLDNQTAKIDTLIDKAKRSIELAKEHRAALISAAITGKIDVREAA